MLMDLLLWTSTGCFSAQRGTVWCNGCVLSGLHLSSARKTRVCTKLCTCRITFTPCMQHIQTGFRVQHKTLLRSVWKPHNSPGDPEQVFKITAICDSLQIHSNLAVLCVSHSQHVTLLLLRTSDIIRDKKREHGQQPHESFEFSHFHLLTFEKQRWNGCHWTSGELVWKTVKWSGLFFYFFEGFFHRTGRHCGALHSSTVRHRWMGSV